MQGVAGGCRGFSIVRTSDFSGGEKRVLVSGANSRQPPATPGNSQTKPTGRLTTAEALDLGALALAIAKDPRGRVAATKDYADALWKLSQDGNAQAEKL